MSSDPQPGSPEFFEKWDSTKYPNFTLHAVIEIPEVKDRSGNMIAPSHAASLQGHCRVYADNPYHHLLTKYGWLYSHTTKIGYHGVVGGFSELLYYGHHTYRYPGTEWNFGIDARPGWAASAGKLGSGRRVKIAWIYKAEGYLKRKTAELRRAAENEARYKAEWGTRG